MPGRVRKHGHACTRSVLSEVCGAASGMRSGGLLRPAAAKAEQYRQIFRFRRYCTDLDGMLDTEKPDAVCPVVSEPLTAALFVGFRIKAILCSLKNCPV